MFLHSIILLFKKSICCRFDLNDRKRYCSNPKPRWCLKTITFLLLLYIQLPAAAQEDEFPKQTTISLFTGLINYQGDLNPNSFTLGRSKLAIGATIRKPLNRWFTVRGGINYGHLKAADRYNRSYLQSRNLSFYTTIEEANA